MFGLAGTNAELIWDSLGGGGGSGAAALVTYCGGAGSGGGALGGGGGAMFSRRNVLSCFEFSALVTSVPT